ncbi:uncharacterized protein LY89DRAFT_177300 [Mollisia scopiformis]|uniref:Uncharacterized protein n=1 Tax=Mollisia scopiformis TaxID=149040 RepID=A0A194XU73_MOLSC|nr:uncharacterized protein LY89DRAFT_177300 [Mollisia scopiformis]KUJ23257.1 hypothetical protein LY89DRAFT_177300 [Mollisia scopiformis]
MQMQTQLTQIIVLTTPPFLINRVISHHTTRQTQSCLSINQTRSHSLLHPDFHPHPQSLTRHKAGVTRKRPDPISVCHCRGQQRREPDPSPSAAALAFTLSRQILEASRIKSRAGLGSSILWHLSPFEYANNSHRKSTMREMFAVERNRQTPAFAETYGYGFPVFRLGLSVSTRGNGNAVLCCTR